MSDREQCATCLYCKEIEDVITIANCTYPVPYWACPPSVVYPDQFITCPVYKENPDEYL